MRVYSSDEIKELALEKSSKAIKYLNDRPLWFKIGCATILVSYGYLKVKWTKLNETSFPIVPPTFSALGTTTQYMSENGYVEFAAKQLEEKKQKSVGFYRLTAPVIMTIDIDIIKPVWTTYFGAFPTRMPTEGSMGIGKEFSTTLDQINDVHQWKRIRSTISPSFSTKQLGEMLSMSSAAQEQLVEDIASLKGESISAKTIMSKFAIDTFLQTAMGVNMNDELKDVRKFDSHPLVKHILTLLNPDPITFLPLLIPGVGYLCDKFGIYLFGKAAFKWYLGLCKSMATESEKTADTGNLRANSIMSLFLKNKIPDSAAKKSTKGLTYDEIIGQNFIFFVAGYETTATTLTWALLELARNSDLQEKCRAEAQSIDFSKLADLKNDVIPNIDATIKETLRIHSPVQVHLRRCVHDTNINGQWFRSGTNVEIPVQALHTCEEYWGENAKKFDVQRWIDDPNLEKNQFYMPFGDGPRNCIGMRFANMIVRASLAHIVKNFKIQFPPTFTDDIHQIQTITAFIRSNKDIPLIFTKV